MNAIETINNSNQEVIVPQQVRKLRKFKMIDGVKVYTKPKKVLIIVNDSDSDDDDETPVAELLARKVASKKAVVKVEFYFPDGVWELIKQFAHYGMPVRCANFNAMVALNHRQIGYLNSPMLLCGEAKTRTYPSVHNTYLNEFGFTDNIEVRVTKTWLCDGCIKGGQHPQRLYAPFENFRRGEIGKRAYDINISKPDKTAGYAKQAKQKAIWNFNKKLEKMSVDESMKDLKENYWKPYLAEAYANRDRERQRQKERIERIQEQERQRQQERIERIQEREQRDRIGAENKEAFFREMATMLSTGELTYIQYDNIVRNSIQHSISSFVRDGYREKFMAYKDTNDKLY